jgi:hypothetical protein
LGAAGVFWCQSYAGLPDFSWHNIPIRENYQITPKYIKGP